MENVSASNSTSKRIFYSIEGFILRRMIGLHEMIGLQLVCRWKPNFRPMRLNSLTSRTRCDRSMSSELSEERLESIYSTMETHWNSFKRCRSTVVVCSRSLLEMMIPTLFCMISRFRWQDGGSPEVPQSEVNSYL
uniref:Uncharacterized protein n=1 Tax=Ditylenchus dipsaci TaxID=166011 RepID=A0A915CYR8_9BILA